MDRRVLVPELENKDYDGNLQGNARDEDYREGRVPFEICFVLKDNPSDDLSRKSTKESE